MQVRGGGGAGAGATPQERERGSHGIQGPRGVVAGLNQEQGKPPPCCRENCKEPRSGSFWIIGSNDKRSQADIKTSQNHSTNI